MLLAMPTFAGAATQSPMSPYLLLANSPLVPQPAAFPTLFDFVPQQVISAFTAPQVLSSSALSLNGVRLVDNENREYVLVPVTSSKATEKVLPAASLASSLLISPPSAPSKVDAPSSSASPASFPSSSSSPACSSPPVSAFAPKRKSSSLSGDGPAAKRAPGMCLAGLSETEIAARKREQNRAAAAKYRDRQRETKKSEKEEKDRLEARNAFLAKEADRLAAEIAEIKNALMNRLQA